ncbi:hypothetical protein [Geoalkalibacter halelectricus]|uniref:hypothetical protein n=1 Tax=Geoalkalibacter halelectricus TaxID=2847045 RepID=UPI003D1C69CC
MTLPKHNSSFSVKNLSPVYMLILFALFLIFLFGCENSSSNDQAVNAPKILEDESNKEQTENTQKILADTSNKEQAVRALKSLEAMMATIEVMDKHNPIKLPYPGLGNPSYYQKMRLNYVEYSKLLSIAQTELNILKRNYANPAFLKEVEGAMLSFTEIGSYLPYMLTGTGYDNNTELKISLGVRSYDELVIRYQEACKKANDHLNNAYIKL